MQGASPEAKRAIGSALHCCENSLVLDMGGRDATYAPVTCDKKWCNSCAREWSRRLTASALRAASQIRATELRHLVLTVPNARHGALESTLAMLYDVFRSWRDEGRRKAHGAFWKKVEGYAWKLEIDGHDRTHTVTNARTGEAHTYRPGWHPHIHCLLHVPEGFNLRRHSPALRAWLRLGAARFGRINAPWITRPGSAAGAAREVVKYSVKPLQIDHARASSLRELAEATHGKRWTGSAGTLQCSAEKPSAGGSIVTNIRALAVKATDSAGHFTEDERNYAAAQLLAWILDKSTDPKTKTRMVDAIDKELHCDLVLVIRHYQEQCAARAAEIRQSEIETEKKISNELTLFDDEQYWREEETRAKGSGA